MNLILSNKKIRTELILYCKWLADQYSKTLEGKYRIKYNSLYPLLYHPMNELKKQEFYDSFSTSLDIYPVESININGISLVKF